MGELMITFPLLAQFNDVNSERKHCILVGFLCSQLYS